MGMTLSTTRRFFAAPLPAAYLPDERAECRKPAMPRRCPAPLSARRPVRVTRVPDELPQAGQAGRMVISGRLDDVCAELERLARLETR